jgi:hypothetical protein
MTEKSRHHDWTPFLITEHHPSKFPTARRSYRLPYPPASSCAEGKTTIIESSLRKIISSFSSFLQSLQRSDESISAAPASQNRMRSPGLTEGATRTPDGKTRPGPTAKTRPLHHASDGLVPSTTRQHQPRLGYLLRRTDPTRHNPIVYGFQHHHHLQLTYPNYTPPTTEKSTPSKSVYLERWFPWSPGF